MSDDEVEIPLPVRRRDPFLRPHTVGLGDGTRTAGQDEKLVFANAVQAHAGLYSQLRDTINSALPSVEEFQRAAGGYKTSIAKVISGKILQYSAVFGPLLGSIMGANAGAAIAAEINKTERGTEKTKETFDALVSVVRHVWAVLFAYQRISVGDLVSNGIMEQAAAESFGKTIGVDGYALMKAYTMPAITDLWGKSIGMAPYLAATDTKWKELVSAIRSIEAKLVALAPVVGVQKTAEQLFEYESKVADVKAGFLAALKTASDEAKARRRIPGWSEQIFNSIVTAIQAGGWAVFGIAGIVYSQFVAPTIGLSDVLSKLSYSSARLIEASAKAATAGAATYADAFKKARIDEKKSDATAAAEAQKKSSEVIKTVGAQEYDAANKDIDAWMNHYQKTLDALEAGLIKFQLGLEALAKYAILAASIIGGAIFLSKAL